MKLLSILLFSLASVIAADEFSRPEDAYEMNITIHNGFQFPISNVLLTHQYRHYDPVIRSWPTIKPGQTSGAEPIVFFTEGAAEDLWQLSWTIKKGSIACTSIGRGFRRIYAEEADWHTHGMKVKDANTTASISLFPSTEEIGIVFQSASHTTRPAAECHWRKNETRVDLFEHGLAIENLYKGRISNCPVDSDSTDDETAALHCTGWHVARKSLVPKRHDQDATSERKITPLDLK